MSWSDKRLKKFLSLLLRHRPAEIGLRLEPGGWARLEELIRKAREHGAPVVLPVRAGRMAEEGHVFYRPVFGIWLVERVPPEFLGEPEEGAGAPLDGRVA